MAVVDELVTLLGFEMSSKSKSALKAAKDGINTVKKSALGLMAVGMGMVTGIAAYAVRVGNQANELERLSQATRLSTTALQEWNYAATKSGVSARNVQNDLAKLQQKFGQRLSSEQITSRISVRLQGMNEGQQQDYAKRLGISRDTLLLLKQGKEGITALREEAHKMGAVIPPESIKIATQFKRTLDTVWLTIRNLGAQVAIGVMPHLQRFLDLFQRWIAQNREFVAGALDAVLQGIGKGFDTIWRALNSLWGLVQGFLPDLGSLNKDFDYFGVIAKTIEGIIVALGVVLAPVIIKFALIAGAIVLAGMAVNDFLTYLRGGDSLIGRFANAFKENFPELAKLLERLGNVLKNVVLWAFERIKNLVVDVAGEMSEAWPKVTRTIEDVAAALNSFFDDAGEGFPRLIGWVRGVGDDIRNLLGSAIEWVTAKFREFIGPLIDVYEMVVGKVGGDKPSPPPANDNPAHEGVGRSFNEGSEPADAVIGFVTYASGAVQNIRRLAQEMQDSDLLTSIRDVRLDQMKAAVPGMAGQSATTDNRTITINNTNNFANPPGDPQAAARMQGDSLKATVGMIQG